MMMSQVSPVALGPTMRFTDLTVALKGALLFCLGGREVWRGGRGEARWVGRAWRRQVGKGRAAVEQRVAWGAAGGGGGEGARRARQRGAHEGVEGHLALLQLQGHLRAGHARGRGGADHDGAAAGRRAGGDLAGGQRAVGEDGRVRRGPAAAGADGGGDRGAGGRRPPPVAAGAVGASARGPRGARRGAAPAARAGRPARPHWAADRRNRRFVAASRRHRGPAAGGRAPGAPPGAASGRGLAGPSRARRLHSRRGRRCWRGGSGGALGGRAGPMSTLARGRSAPPLAPSPQVPARRDAPHLHGCCWRRLPGIAGKVKGAWARAARRRLRAGAFRASGRERGRPPPLPRRARARCAPRRTRGRRGRAGGGAAGRGGARRAGRRSLRTLPSAVRRRFLFRPRRPLPPSAPRPNARATQARLRLHSGRRGSSGRAAAAAAAAGGGGRQRGRRQRGRGRAARRQRPDGVVLAIVPRRPRARRARQRPPLLLERLGLRARGEGGDGQRRLLRIRPRVPRASPPLPLPPSPHLEQRPQAQAGVVNGGDAAAGRLDGGARGRARGADLQVQRAVDLLRALGGGTAGGREGGGARVVRCGSGAAGAGAAGGPAGQASGRQAQAWPRARPARGAPAQAA
jgi:hypothetical protein